MIGQQASFLSLTVINFENKTNIRIKHSEQKFVMRGTKFSSCYRYTNTQYKQQQLKSFNCGKFQRN